MNPLAMIDMKSKLKGDIQSHLSSSKYNANNFTSTDSKLEESEVRILKDIIHGDKKPLVEDASAKVMSLDEAVNFIKNGR